jgi:hypothetical protein
MKRTEKSAKSRRQKEKVEGICIELAFLDAGYIAWCWPKGGCRRCAERRSKLRFGPRKERMAFVSKSSEGNFSTLFFLILS